MSRQKTGQFVQTFWENPGQVTLTTLEPVTRYVTTVTEQSEQYWQMLLDNPEQFMVNALAPVTGYLNALNDTAEAALISSYSLLAEVFGLLIAQPSETLKALYYNTLSALLEIYFDVISSLLAIA